MDIKETKLQLKVQITEKKDIFHYMVKSYLTVTLWEKVLHRESVGAAQRDTQ